MLTYGQHITETQLRSTSVKVPHNVAFTSETSDTVQKRFGQSLQTYGFTG